MVGTCWDQASGVRSRSLFRLAASLVGNKPSSQEAWTEVNLKNYVRTETWILAYFCEAVMWYIKLSFQRTLTFLIRSSQLTAAQPQVQLLLAPWQCPADVGRSILSGWKLFKNTRKAIAWNQEEWEAIEISENGLVYLSSFSAWCRGWSVLHGQVSGL